MRQLRSGFLIVLMLPFIFGIGMMDVSLVGDIIHQAATALHPSVMGTLTHSEVTDGNLRVQYTYEVDGRAYRGYRYRAYSINYDNSKALEGLRGLLPPVGSPVEVFYQPGAPQESVLVKGVDRVEFLMLLFITPFNLMILLPLLMAARSLSRGPEGVHSFQRDGRTHTNLATFSPLEAGLLVSGIANVGAMLAHGTLVGGLQPPLPVLSLLWGIVLGSGIFVGVRRRARWKAGDYDLIIDPHDRSISLPPIFGRKQRIEVAWSQIHSLAVKTSSSRNSKGKVSRTHHPEITFVEDGGEIRSESLGWGSSGGGASALIRWLESRIERGSPPTPSQEQVRGPPRQSPVRGGKPR
jgi:hypothetical protein